MSTSQQLLLARINKRIQSIVSQYLKVFENGQSIPQDCYDFVKEIDAKIQKKVDVHCTELCVFFCRRLSVPFEDCDLLKSMGTEHVFNAINKDSVDTLKSYLQGLYTMSQKYVKRYLVDDEKVAQAMNICSTGLEDVHTGEQSSQNLFIDALTETYDKIKDLKDSSQVANLLVDSLPTMIKSDLPSITGMTADETKMEIRRIIEALSTKSKKTKLKKHAVGIISVISSVLKAGKTAILLRKFITLGGAVAKATACNGTKAEKKKALQKAFLIPSNPPPSLTTVEQDMTIKMTDSQVNLSPKESVEKEKTVTKYPLRKRSKELSQKV